MTWLALHSITCAGCGTPLEANGLVVLCLACESALGRPPAPRRGAEEDRS